MRIKCISIILAFLFTYQLYTSAIIIEFIKMTVMIHIDHCALDSHSQEQDIGNHDNELLLRTLGPRKRKALELFKMFAVVTAAQIGQLFGFRPRTSAQLCKDWVEEGFLVIVNPSNKSRSYSLSPKYEVLVMSPI
jgi:hypothetical protein